MENKKKTPFTQKFDLFGQRAFLFVKNSELLTSNTGGCLSILLMVSAIATFVFFLVQMLSRNIVTISTTTHIDPNASFDANSENYIFALGFNKSTNEMLKNALTYQLQVSHYHTYANGTQIKDNQFYGFVPCTENHFVTSKFNFSDDYRRNNLGDYFCPDTKSYPLYGGYLSTDFKFFKMSLLPCDNKTSNNTCAPQEEIDKALTGGRLRLQYYYIDNIMNLNDFDNPVLPYLTNMEWLLTPLDLKIFSNMYVTNQTINSSVSYLYSGSNDTKSSFTSPLQNFRDEVYYYKTPEVFSLTVRMDQNSVSFYRNYMKTPDLLSKVGGLIPLLFTLFGYMAIRYNQYKMKTHIANDIYNTDADEDSEERHLTQARALSFTNKISDIESNTSGVSINTKKTQKADKIADRKLSAFHRIFAQFLDKDKIRSHIGRYLENILCRCNKRSRDRLFQFRSAQEKLKEDLDVISIVKKINQLDKMKELLFTRNQLEVFNFTPEPKLYKNEETSFLMSANDHNPTYIKKREDYHSMPSLIKMYLSYKRLQKDQNPQRKRINQEIINMLGSEMIYTLERFDQEIENDPTLLPYLMKVFPDVDCYDKDGVSANVLGSGPDGSSNNNNILYSPSANKSKIHLDLDVPLINHENKSKQQ